MSMRYVINALYSRTYNANAGEKDRAGNPLAPKYAKTSSGKKSFNFLSDEVLTGAALKDKIKEITKVTYPETFKETLKLWGKEISDSDLATDTAITYEVTFIDPTVTEPTKEEVNATPKNAVVESKLTKLQELGRGLAAMREKMDDAIESIKSTEVVETPAETPAPVVETPAETPAPVVETPAETPAENPTEPTTDAPIEP